MPTLGEELKRRREERGISLSDISEATRIGSRFLKAIEADNFSALPGGIFTRSFIRAYARHIGMNEEEALALYREQVGDGTEEAAQSQLEQKPAPPVAASGAHRTILTIVIVAVVILGVFLLIRALNQNGNASDHNANTGSPANDTGKNANERRQTAVTPAASPSPAQETLEQLQAGLPTSLLKVSLEAIDGDCWLRYQVDEAESEAILLTIGEKIELPEARNRVKLSIGNRRNLSLRINDKAASFPAQTPNFGAQIVISRENLPEFFP